MSCRETRENLGAYLNQTLPENEARQVAEHVAECRACAGALAGSEAHARGAGRPLPGTAAVPWV